MTEEKANLDSWKRLLASLESSGNKLQVRDLDELEQLLRHLSPQVAVRLQKDYETCTKTSEQLFEQLFDRMDLADKPLLCSYLRMLKSFAFFRLAQITYCVAGLREIEDPIYTPAFVKAKWYDMTPILPRAGDLGWKAVMNHGLVKEEKEMLPICIELLSMKLHSLAIIMKLDRFHEYNTVAKRNGKKVADKLFELIRDVAYDDESLIGLIDVSMFNLLMPFIDESQQPTLIEAVVQNLFKLHMLIKTTDYDRATIDSEINRLCNLITSCVMNRTHLQDLLFNELLTNLKCNAIRRKRRHSVEGASDNGTTSSDPGTLESLIGEISETGGKALPTLLNKALELELKSKSLQSDYISYWTQVLNKIIVQRTLTNRSSLKILATCSLLLVSASSSMKQDLINSLSSLMASTIENTSQSKLPQLFEHCNPITLIELTKILSAKGELISTFDAPVQQFYKSFLDRYLKASLFRNCKKNAEDFTKFVDFVCDKSLGKKDTSRLLQYICLHQLSNCMIEFKSKTKNAIMEDYMNCVRTCSTQLYRSIKKCSLLKSDQNSAESADESQQEIVDMEAKRSVIIEALVCILIIATDRKDQELLDKFGGLLLKLYDAVCARVGRLNEIIQSGISYDYNSLDAHLTRLLSLYIEHKDKITIYLNYDVVEKIISLLTIEQTSNGCEKDPKDKRVVYKQIKKRLDELSEKAQHSQNVYPMIINKQYSSVVDPSLVSYGDIKKEKPCYYGYWNEMRTLKEVRELIINNCDAKAYKNLLANTVQWLEQCDPLDHARVLYFLLMLESSIPAHNVNNPVKHGTFREFMPRISCSLVRLTKSVEFGPSIHAFTKSGEHRSIKGIQCCTYSKCITIYTLIFLRCPPSTTSTIITDAIELCVNANLIQYAKYSARLHKFFIQLASSISGLLLKISLAKKEHDTLDCSMPTFLEILSHLVRCIIIASDRQKLEKMPKLSMTNGHGGKDNNNGEEDEEDNDDDEENSNQDNHSNYENQLKLLAIDIGRTLNNLSSLRVKMVEYAPHLIAAYIKDIQRASCPDFVRLHLNEAIFRIFNLVDAHQKERQEELLGAGIQRKTNAARAKGSLFEMIHARLDQASREIFRDLHENYESLHRYRAKC